MIVRCPQCQAGNPHELQVGSKEITCQRCGSVLQVWSAQFINADRTPHPVAVMVKVAQKWDPDSEGPPAERYVLALERQLMEYAHERESMERPRAPRRQWHGRRALMVAALALALSLGFTVAKVALNVFGPMQAQAGQMDR